MLDTGNSRHAHIAERLRTNTIIWLISVRHDGRPHVVAVWFLWDEVTNTILIFTKPEQQKVKNIRSNPRVALAIDDSMGGADPITIEGHAEIVDDPSIDTTLPLYVEKYSERMKRIGLYPPEKMAEVYSQCIRINLEKLLG